MTLAPAVLPVDMAMPCLSLLTSRLTATSVPLRPFLQTPITATVIRLAFVAVEMLPATGTMPTDAVGLFRVGLLACVAPT